MAIEQFDEATQKQYLEDDREAWYSICLILLGIICVGLSLAVLAVWLVTRIG